MHGKLKRILSSLITFTKVDQNGIVCDSKMNCKCYFIKSLFQMIILKYVSFMLIEGQIKLIQKVHFPIVNEHKWQMDR
jgi:hypothetical protein